MGSWALLMVALMAAAACGSVVVIGPGSGEGGAGGDAGAGGSGAAASSTASGMGGSASGGGGSLPSDPCEGVFAHAVSFGSPGHDEVEAMLVDPSGNVFVAGRTVGTVTAAALGVVSPGLGGGDVFLARFEPDLGAVGMAVLGDGLDQRIRDMAFDPDGNLVVVGESVGDINFGGGPLIPNTAGSDIFVAKLTSLGEHIWSVMFSGAGNDVAHGVAVDPLGRITVVGSFEQDITVGNTALASSGDADVLVMRLDAGGNPQWAHGFGDWDFQFAKSVAALSDGAVAITGNTRGKLDFGGGALGPEPGNIPLNAFLVKLDVDGAHQWSTHFQSPDMLRGRTIAVDSNDALVTAGQFLGSVEFMGLPLTSAGQFDIYMLKVTAGGTPLWARRWGDGLIQGPRQVTTTPSNQILLGAPASGVTDFGCGPAGLPPGHQTAAFVKLHPDGSHAFSMFVGDPPNAPISSHQFGHRAIETLSGDLVVLGSFQGSVQLGDQVFSSVGALDLFLGVATQVP